MISWDVMSQLSHASQKIVKIFFKTFNSVNTPEKDAYRFITNKLKIYGIFFIFFLRPILSQPAAIKLKRNEVFIFKLYASKFDNNNDSKRF